MRTSKFLNRVPGAVKGRKCGCFSAGRANNRAWRRRALREENPKPDANASSRRQVSRRKWIVQKTHLCGARARLPGPLPRGRHGVNWRAMGLPMGRHAIARAATPFAARIGHKGTLGYPRVKIREDRVDAALVVENRRSSGRRQKHPRLLGNRAGDRIAQRMSSNGGAEHLALRPRAWARGRGHHRCPVHSTDATGHAVPRARLRERAADDAP